MNKGADTIHQSDKTSLSISNAPEDYRLPLKVILIIS